MQFEDAVYGRQEIQEPVLRELIGSAPVQRLKRINQSGPANVFLDKPQVTRFQHSVGVMLLLREHGASLEEQIAGLLHDVPHTAFSHVADFVFANEDHEYHEQFMDRIVYDSEIPATLREHGIDVDYILDESNFPLLERDPPDLCADRIDYFLRDATAYTERHDEIRTFRDAVTTRDDRFVLEDGDVAERYALTYLEMDEQHWASPKAVAVFELFAQVLRRALDVGVLTEDDLFGTDQEVYDTVAAATDPEIQNMLSLLENGFTVKLDENDWDFRRTTKVRYVDPLVVANRETFRVSEQSERVRDRIQEHESFVGSGYPIKLVT